MITSLLYKRFQKELAPKLQKDLGLKNPMQVPKIEKICVNVGMGSYILKSGKKDYSFVEKTLSLITGQKPVLRNSRMSVSNFKLREGMPVGLSVTLRGVAAYNFLEKVINIALPRVRDFRGVSRKIFDKKGNCSIGFTDQTVFPEGELRDDLSKPYGLQVTVVTNTDNSDHSLKLLEMFGFPFRKDAKKEAKES